MENNANRWMATIAILGLFGIFAAAGSHGPVARQGVQNVLVTNTSSQPVPIAARPGTGAYIVSVANAPGVKVLNSGDPTSADVHGLLNIDSPNLGNSSPLAIPNSTPVIIDSVSAYSNGSPGEYVNLVTLEVDSGFNVIAEAFFAPQPLANSSTSSAFTTNYRVFVPKGGAVTISASRGATTGSTLVNFTVSYHTLTM